MSPNSPPTVEGGQLYPVETLRAFTVQAFLRCGVAEPDAEVVADSLLEADLRGVDSHGVTRLLGTYVKRLRRGVVNPRPTVRLVDESAATLLFDGDNGLGAVVGKQAMEACIQRARAAGAAWAGVRHSNHFGACAYYTLMAAQSDHVGIAMTNSPPAMAPWGGVTPYLGTNPLSIALPAEAEPVVLDMATSVAARGHIILAAARGEATIPPGWALDARGRPTTDTREALAGLAMPLGGHKGYGLAMAIEALCGLLTGAAFGPGIGSLSREFQRPQDVGHLFGALDVGRMVPLEAFKARLGQMCRELRACTLAEGFERIYVPGEIEAEQRQRRLREGIPVPEPIREEFRALGSELGIAFE
ncbi:MAG: Ldh family oxidoreductase [Chloroflexi bacterium]|nr:Ldh family oxidoreductase [Chloroflexota bacterium]